MWSTLYDYPKLRECKELNIFIGDAVRTAWSIIIYEPQMKIDYSSSKFDKTIHERSQNSNKLSEHIAQYIWPALIDKLSHNCLMKGVVIT